MSGSLVLVGARAGTVLASWLGQALLFGSLVACLTWLLACLAGRRLTPGIQAVLWSIVLVKFVCPFGPGQPLSLGTLLQAIQTRVAFDIGGNGLAEADPGQPGTSSGQESGTSRRPAGALSMAPASLVGTLTLFYLASVSVLVAARSRSYRRFLADCRSLPEADPATARLVREVCARLEVRRAPTVRVSNELPAPFITGVLRPVLVLSRLQLVRPDELEAMVVHEVTHLRRGDLVVRCLQWIAGALFFFWPVVAWVNRRLDAAREHACDQWALRHGKLSATDYARCLLRAARAVSAHQLAYRPAYMAGTTSTIERRIDMILKSSSEAVRRPRWQAAALVLLLLGWGGFVLTGSVRAGTPASPAQQVTAESVDAHAAAVVKRISAYPSADVDGDGAISFDERNAFLVALYLSSPDTALDLFPYSAPFRGRDLGPKEAYDLVRGLSYRNEVGRPFKQRFGAAKEQGAPEEQLKEIQLQSQEAELRAVAVVLDAQDALLDSLHVAPDAATVAALHAKVSKSTVKVTVEEMRAKSEGLKQKISELEAAGEQEKADELRQHLADLETKLKQLEVTGK